MIQPAFEILNQRGTPMFFSDVFANRPTAGIVGRIFISTDTYAFYRDTGSGWDLIGGPGSGTITGSGTIGTLPIWNGTQVIGDSSLLEGASKFTTTKDFQADGYYLSGMTAGSGALYWTSDRVTLANYNPTGDVHIEVAGGQAAQVVLGSNLSTTFYGNIIRNGGLSTQFLKADGSLDSSTYITTNIYNGNGTLSGNRVVSLNSNYLSFAGGQIYIGSQTASSGLLTINNASSDAHIQVVGASAPSIRIDNAGTGATQRLVFGLATATNNFIQGSTAGDICISTASASPLLFGMWQTINASEVMRMSTSNNLLIGTTTDAGYKLYVSGTLATTGNATIGTLAGSGSRMVVADANGLLSTQAIPSGTISGSGTTNYVPKFSSGSVIGNSLLVDNGTNLTYSGEEFIVNKSTGSFLTLLSSDTATQYIQFTDTGGATGSIRYNHSTNGMIFKTNGNDALTLSSTSAATFSSSLTSSGELNVGNGTLSADRLFQISGISFTTGSNQFMGVFNTSFNGTMTNAYGVYVGNNFITGSVTNSYNLYIENTAAGSATITNKWGLYQSGSSDKNYFAANVLIGTTTDLGYKLYVNGTGLFSNNLLVNAYVITPSSASSGNISGFINQYAGDPASRSWKIANDLYLYGDFGILQSTTQTGSTYSAKMYFGNTGNVIIGSTTDQGQKLYLNGSLRIDGQTAATAGGASGQHLIINCDGTTYKIALLNN